MDSRFVKGARVRVIAVTEGSNTKLGQIGTLLETSLAPWIEFDEPTTWDLPVRNYEIGIQGDPMGIVGKAGFCDCLMLEELEIAED